MRPQRFWSTEYVVATVGIGIPHSSASARAFSRAMPASRIGATIVRSGASTENDTSNRTWSLPLPVHPCASVPASTSRATRTISSAMHGRASADTIGYAPS